MKILIWVLNIIQFIIVYFLVFSLFFTGVLQAIDPSIGLSGETFWPLMSMGIAGVPWKYYNRFSLFITSKRLKAPAEEVVVEEASKSTLYKEKIIKKETYKQEMTNKDVKKNRTKFISILKKIFIIIISLTLIVTISIIGFFEYDRYMESLKMNPESEYFDYSYKPSLYPDLTVIVDGVRYVKYDMSLFSGKLSGSYSRIGTLETKYYQKTYVNGKLNGNYYEWIYKQWTTRAFYKDGKLEGLRRSWFDNFQLKTEGFYENGLLQGYYKEWDKDGNLIKHTLMKDNYLVLQSKIEKLYQFYLREGMISESISLERFRNVTPDQQASILELSRKRKLISPETSLESFQSIWSDDIQEEVFKATN